MEHGEPQISASSGDVQGYECQMGDNENEGLGGIGTLLEDRMRGEMGDTTQREEVQNFDKLLDDAKREIYPGCKDFTLLKFVITILNVKVINNWSNKSLDILLGFLMKLLPQGNFVLRSTYEAKRYYVTWVRHTSISMHVRMIACSSGRRLQA